MLSPSLSPPAPLPQCRLSGQEGATERGALLSAQRPDVEVIMAHFKEAVDACRELGPQLVSFESPPM